MLRNTVGNINQNHPSGTNMELQKALNQLKKMKNGGTIEYPQVTVPGHFTLLVIKLRATLMTERVHSPSHIHIYSKKLIVLKIFPALPLNDKAS